MEHYEDPRYQILENKMINAATGEEVQSYRREAFYKGWQALVAQGRAILLFTFGWKKNNDGLLTPPNTL